MASMGDSDGRDSINNLEKGEGGGGGVGKARQLLSYMV